MKLEDARWLRSALPHGRTLYRYYKDRYSLQLLRYAVPFETSVQALRASSVAGLLQKPRVRDVLARCDGRLSPSLLQQADGDPADECYVLSLGLWRGQQMSRDGCNLVLQLNFARSHDGPFRHLVRPEEGVDPFNYYAHPVLDDERRERRYTLAWSRIDVDLDAGEALIEEVQSDWVRWAAVAQRLASRFSEDAMLRRFGVRADAERMQRYQQMLLARHAAVWDEAMLSATLFFLREELGIRHIYYHTHASGQWLKRIRDRLPPRSLYTELPRRFCFRETDALPGFLARTRRIARMRKAHGDLRMHVLQV